MIINALLSVHYRLLPVYALFPVYHSVCIVCSFICLLKFPPMKFIVYTPIGLLYCARIALCFFSRRSILSALMYKCCLRTVSYSGVCSFSCASDHSLGCVAIYHLVTSVVYSPTSHNGPSEKRTTSLQRTPAVLRIDITIVFIHTQPPRSGRF